MFFTSALSSVPLDVVANFAVWILGKMRQRVVGVFALTENQARLPRVKAAASLAEGVVLWIFHSLRQPAQEEQNPQNLSSLL